MDVMTATYEEISKRVSNIPFWYHKIELPYGITTPGYAPIDKNIYGIPERLDGKRVLDVGAWDGFWSFEAIKRGAREVVAIDEFSDYISKDFNISRSSKWETFDLCRDILGITGDVCKRMEMSVYEVNRNDLGLFDVVFFFGTLYHLRHPLLALDNLSSICSEEIYVESAICDDFSPYVSSSIVEELNTDKCVMEFYPDDQYGNNSTNWWAPSLKCLGEMVRSAGFTNIDAWKIAKPVHVSYCRGFARGRKHRLTQC